MGMHIQLIAFEINNKSNKNGLAPDLTISD